MGEKVAQQSTLKVKQLQNTPMSSFLVETSIPPTFLPQTRNTAKKRICESLLQQPGSRLHLW